MGDGPRIDKEALASIPAHDIQRVLDKIQWLWNNRRAITHNPLRGNLSGFFKRRLGPYRIIYTYDANPDELVVRLAATRDEIYEEAAKRLAAEGPEK